MRKLLLFLKIAGGIVVVTVVLMVGATYLLNTSSFQNRLLKYATEQLSSKLGTRVKADSVHVNIFSQQVELYGIEVDDQQQRRMLAVNQLSARVSLTALRRDELKIRRVTLKGCQALLLKSDTDSVANYQFVIDSLRRKKTEPDAQAAATDSGQIKKRLTFDVNNITMEDVAVQYNDTHIALDRLSYRQPIMTIDSLRFKTDNHRPRKNHGKPHRGAFDAGHLDLTANIQATVDSYANDTVALTITQANAADRVTGIDVRDLRMNVVVSRREVRLRDVTIQQGNTILTFSEGNIQLPNKKEERRLAYATSAITGNVVLKDIAKPFAPTLKGFTMPLLLRTQISGDDNAMEVGNTEVKTPDKRLLIKAHGRLTDLKDSRKLAVRFSVPQLYARQGTTEQIINQFKVNRLMMKQLHALGDIRYAGQFAVLWRKEQFNGQLRTKVGNVDFHFTIDETSKYITGTVHSPAINLGKTFDLPDIGTAFCKANFKIDISIPRTAKMRRLKGGKLPIGHVDAEVEEVTYKKIKVRNILVDINSDGAMAEGRLNTRGRHIDLRCNFSFTNTDELKKMKVTNPGIKLHKLSDEDRQKKAEEKLLKKQKKEEEKQLKKQKKEEEKKMKAEQKEQEKQKKKKKFLGIF